MWKNRYRRKFHYEKWEKEQLEDHSILVAFAPKNNPKIALAVFVENGGYGSTIAAPISSLLIEKYMNGKISKQNKYRERTIIEKNLEHIYAKQIPKTENSATGKKITSLQILIGF